MRVCCTVCVCVWEREIKREKTNICFQKDREKREVMGEVKKYNWPANGIFIIASKAKLSAKLKQANVAGVG